MGCRVKEQPRFTGGRQLISNPWLSASPRCSRICGDSIERRTQSPTRRAAPDETRSGTHPPGYLPATTMRALHSPSSALRNFQMITADWFADPPIHAPE
jgi:hypothetical protein